jgi:hypothetical protein
MNPKSLPETTSRSSKRFKFSSSIEIDNSAKGEKQLSNESLHLSGNLEIVIISLNKKVDAMSAKIMQLENELLALKNAPDVSSDISGTIKLLLVLLLLLLVLLLLLLLTLLSISQL